MKIIKILLLVLFSLTLSSCARILLAYHEHEYETAYSFDETYHWKQATCCDKKKDYGVHTSSDYCSKCRYLKESYETLEDGTLSLKVASTMESEYEIKTHFEDTKITKIGDQAFNLNRFVQKVEISETIEEIGTEAFRKCTSLTEVVFPENSKIKKIGERAFEDCCVLSTIKLPDTVEEIALNAFEGCEELETIVLPKNLKTIGDDVFYECRYLHEIYFNGSINDWVKIKFTRPENNPMTIAKVYMLDENGQYYLPEVIEIPEDVTIIGDYQFYNSNIKEVKMHNVNIIGKEAFRKNQSLTKAILSSNLEVIGAGAFADDIYLQEIMIPDQVKIIEDYTFLNCESLYQLTLPKSLQKIGKEAFSECELLTKVEIPSGVVEIGNKAFYNCEEVTELSLPKTVKFIDEEAFYMDNLCRVYYDGSISDWCDIEFKTIHSNPMFFNPVTFNPLFLGKFFYLLNDDGIYEEQLSIVIPDSVTKIKQYQFYGFKRITSFTLSKNLTHIDKYAFAFCTNLKSIKIPDAVLELGIGAFSNAQQLEEVVLSKQLKKISAEAFTNTRIKKIILPSDVTIIENKAFKRCKSLSEIIFSANIQTISEEAFAECTSLNSLKIPDTVVEVGVKAFYGCVQLQKVTLSKKLLQLREYVFAGCLDIREIYIPRTIQEIHQYAFINDLRIRNIYFEGTREEWIALNYVVRNEWGNPIPDVVIHYNSEI